METEEIIRQLGASGLYAECPCGEEFRLSDAILFDGTKPFPPEAVKSQRMLEQSLQDRLNDLQKTKKRATIATQKTTTAVNIGQEMDKICPALGGFRWDPEDCRFLGNPIDFIAFDGLAHNRIRAINFVEIKTGKACLNKHQKSIREAIEDKKVSYRESA